jgi:hypothetical protein
VNSGGRVTSALVRTGGALVMDADGTPQGVTLTSVCKGRRTYNNQITVSLYMTWNDGFMTMDNGLFYAEGIDNGRGITIDGNRLP